MPSKLTAPTLRSSCIQSIATHYERICYGCNTKAEMNFLLDVEEEDQESVSGYKAFPGPFTQLPSSILEDIIHGINDSRGLPKQMLHQTILPQLESYKIRSRTSRHIQTRLLSQNCKLLKKMEFSYSKSIAPTFYINFFKNFPFLVVIDVCETVLDNQSFESIGQTCPLLKELNASGSTISDTGLEYLSVGSSEEGELKLRCTSLISINIENTRCSAAGVAKFLYYHPNILLIHFENFSPVFQFFESNDFLSVTKSQPNYLTAFNLRKLTFSGGEVTEKGFMTAVTSCPFLDTLMARQTDLSNTLLAELMTVSTLTSLHLGNSSFSRHWLHFEDGVLPLLWSVGARLVSLKLEKFNRVDVLQIGTLCPRLQNLRLSCIGSYVPVFDQSRIVFDKLVELELLNTRGAHVYAKAIHQILDCATHLRYASFQFIDTLNDEVWREILDMNPLQELESLTLDQCHSVSVYSLEEILTRPNMLSSLACWSCRFITETDRDTLVRMIKLSNYDLHFSWYPFTGEEAPMPLEDIEDDDDEEEEEETSEEDEDYEFLNYWNNPPLPGRALVNPELD